MPEIIEMEDNDESFCEGDVEVDWSHVEELAAMFDEVDAITDDAERLEAAKRLVDNLNEES